MAPSVFINCPFDRDYTLKFRAIIFTVVYCGFVPRCALELDDASENRLAKIVRIIGKCRFGIHDISRTQLDRSSKLPRFNMPFELGIFFGAKQFGGAKHSRKSCLILDTDRYRYQQFLSDISGQDIRSHTDDPKKVIALVRNWLSQHADELLPGDKTLVREFASFLAQLPGICRRLGLNTSELIYNDFVNIMQSWIAKRATVA
jgi:hypothetical protein